MERLEAQLGEERRSREADSRELAVVQVCCLCRVLLLWVMQAWLMGMAEILPQGRMLFAVYLG